MQSLDLVERHVGPGRVIGIGKEDDPGARGHPRQDGIDIGGVVGFRRGDWRRAGAQRRDRIDEETMNGVDRFIAVDEIGARQQVEEIVRPRAADDARRIEPESAPDRLAERGRRAVGVIRQPRRLGLISSNRARAWSQRRLVRGQLVYLGNAWGTALSGHIGVDCHHAGPRNWARAHSKCSATAERAAGAGAIGGDRVAARMAADERVAAHRRSRAHQRVSDVAERSLRRDRHQQRRAVKGVVRHGHRFGEARPAPWRDPCPIRQRGC